MRGCIVKRLRNLARSLHPNSGSTLLQKEDGSFFYNGLIRTYRDLKKEWKDSNIFKKEVFFK